MAIKEKETEEIKKAKKREAQEEKFKEKIEEKIKETEKMEQEKEPKEVEKVKKTFREREREEALASWIPKTKLGKDVKEGRIKDINEIFNKNLTILESEIVDILLPNIETDFINIGQIKGKFGGGKRLPRRQTQKKTAEGNVPKFACLAVVGDKKGHVGVGYGKTKETVPAKQKSIKNAKMNLIKIKRGCGSFDCVCNEPHSIPLAVKGKMGSTVIKLMPAPKGTGLVIEDECKKIMKLAGIKDIYSKTFGQTKTKFNLIKACVVALQKLNKII